MQGQIITRLLNNQYRAAGTQTVEWNAANFPSGAYIFKIKTKSYTVTKKNIALSIVERKIKPYEVSVKPGKSLRPFRFF